MATISMNIDGDIRITPFVPGNGLLWLNITSYLGESRAPRDIYQRSSLILHGDEAQLRRFFTMGLAALPALPEVQVVAPPMAESCDPADPGPEEDSESACQPIDWSDVAVGA